MANKAKKSSKGAAASSDENVVRIKASSSSSKKTKAEQAETTATPIAGKAAKPMKVKKPGTGIRGFGALRTVGNYFKGAWVELRLVRWPTRSATWSLTFAVLAYSAFFVLLVLLLDAAFKYLFDFILKS